MLVLAWLVATDGSLALIIALAILATCFSTFFSPTIGAYLPSLVRDERQLGPANSAWAMLDNLAFVIGPAVAGILIAFSDLTLAFVLNAASFAVVAAVLWRLPPSKPRAVGAESRGRRGADSRGGAGRGRLPPPAISSIVRPVAG
jgi:MFS family permease